MLIVRNSSKILFNISKIDKKSEKKKKTNNKATKQ